MNDKFQEIFELEGETKWDLLSDDKCYIYNANTNTYAYISHSALLVVEQIDGEKSIKQIADILTENNSTINDYEHIYDFICKELAQLGFIKNENFKKKASLVRFNKIIINENITNIISSFLCPLFNKRFVTPFYIISVLVILFLLILYANPSDELYNSQINYFGLIGSTVFLLFGHEFGHTTAMKRFGVSAKGVGVGFYFFTPVLYADVSEAWKLNNRQRVIVDVGGVFFQSIITILYLIYAITFQSPTVLNVVYLSIFLLFFNMNPFIKSDFYWCISDYLDRPNMLEESSKEVMKLFKNRSVSNINIINVIFGGLRFIFIMLVMILIICLFYSSMQSVFSGHYKITFWTIERDILICISMFFFVYEIKNFISNTNFTPKDVKE